MQTQLKQIQSQKPSSKQTVEDKTLTELKNFVQLKEALKMMNITKQKWYRVYQHILRHKTYNRDTWVYLPSMLNFMQTNNINDK